MLMIIIENEESDTEYVPNDSLYYIFFEYQINVHCHSITSIRLYMNNLYIMGPSMSVCVHLICEIYNSPHRPPTGTSSPPSPSFSSSVSSLCHSC